MPFVPQHDCQEYVDGKPRLDGVREFLGARQITLLGGTPSDPPPSRRSALRAAARNAMVLRRIHAGGWRVFEGSRRYLVAAARAGLRRAVVFSCANTAEVLTVSGLAPLVELTVDGVTIHAERLWGKPAPDTFLAAVKRLGSRPVQCAVVEDALSGVAAGRAGHFGYVLGVDRVDQGEGLREHGADTVVGDLAELLDRS